MSWSTRQVADLMSERGWYAAKSALVALQGARVIDPASDLDTVTDLLIDKGKIVKIGSLTKSDLKDAKVIDLEGKIVAPGFFDMHVHLREPGREDKETIFTGTTAAAAGGFTGLCCMPNTNPTLDNTGVVRWVFDLASGSPVSVYPVAAITKGREGKELTEISDLYHAGVRMLSDDGDPVLDAGVMRRALEYSSMHDMVISTHSEDPNLAGDGVMREGEMSTRLGLKPWPSLAESVMVARDVQLAGFTGGRLHVGHISSKESIDMVRWAKKQGYKVTAEATPHHIALTDEACATYDPNFKMNPPLGTDEDRLAVLQGLKDGTIDCISTDHAPHTIEDKLHEFDRAPNGIIGLETSVGIIAKELVRKDMWDWVDVVKHMAINPRKILRLKPAYIKEGAPAELTLIDPNHTWTVEPKKFFSKARNTPFGGWELPAMPIGILNRGWMLIAPHVVE